MNRKVLFIGLGALVLVGALWMLLLYRPAGSELTEARDELDQRQTEKSTLDTQLVRLRSLEAELPLMQSGIESLRAAIPDDPALADFLLAANEAAAASGVELEAISAGAPEAVSGGPFEMTIALSFDAGYYQTLDFLNRLHSMQRIVKVDSLKLTAGQDEEDPTAPPSLGVTIGSRIFANGGGVAAPEAEPAPADEGADGAPEGDTPEEGES